VQSDDIFALFHQCFYVIDHFHPSAFGLLFVELDHMPLACVWMLLDVLGIFFSIMYYNKLAVSGIEKRFKLDLAGKVKWQIVSCSLFSMNGLISYANMTAVAKI
jgi:hypothetical protein